MLIDTQEGKVLINEVAYNLISREAPEELPLYVTTRNQYFADPEKFVQPVKPEDDELGFGATIVFETFTQLVFPLVTPILSYLLEQVAEAIQEEGAKQAVNWVRSLFKEQPKASPIFTQEQLQVIAVTIQNIANTEAERLGLDTEQAQTVSDSVIARLALAKK